MIEIVAGAFLGIVAISIVAFCFRPEIVPVGNSDLRMLRRCLGCDTLVVSAQPSPDQLKGRVEDPPMAIISNRHATVHYWPARRDNFGARIQIWLGERVFTLRYRGKTLSYHLAGDGFAHNADTWRSRHLGLEILKLVIAAVRRRRNVSLPKVGQVAEEPGAT